MKWHALFLRIFLWFLGSMLLMAAVSVSLTVFMSRQGIILTGHQEVLSDALDRHGAKLVETYEEKGRVAAFELSDLIRRETGLAILLFDGNGAPIRLRGGPPMEFLNRLGREAAGELAQGRTFQIRRETVSVYKRLVSPSGKTYLLVGLFRRPPSMARLFTDNPKSVLIHLAGLLAAALVFCGLLAHHLSKPLVKLSRMACSVAEGQLDTPVDLSIRKRRDEIGELARSLEAMKNTLTALLEAQRRLIRDISHELRTPLARLGIALELARKKAGPAAEDSLDRIERESAILNEMIGQLLDLSRAEAEIGQDFAEPGDLLGLIEAVIDDANFEARAADRGVLLEAPETLPPVHMNRELVRRAVENIVRNALRYTAEGTRIEVRVTEREKEGRPGVSIRIRDFGPGVPEGELPRIFQPFY
ncbi:MAG: HAMP domain-containing protein, partial [Synergistaceae bacterium]|nr:HAMP domain-containing protein [Synergistaceae bacterium]